MKCSTCSHENPQSAAVCTSCGTALTPFRAASSPGGHDLTKGVRLNGGAYAIGEKLGQGGFGITYKGGDLSLRRYVAIKEFYPHGASRQGTTVVAPTGLTSEQYSQARGAFLAEAQTLARFTHPGIVRVFGAFEDNNTAYMVMELLEGESLQRAVEREGPLLESEALALIAQVGEALTAVHEVHLLHRDIKPDNIVLVTNGAQARRAILIDFGTAREFARDKTRSMTAMVTPGYAPLEQYGKQAKFGPYTDIYALGGTLYHCLTGRQPVSAMDRLAGVELSEPASLNPKVSRQVSAAVIWAMQIKATDRPQSVKEWLDVLLNTAPFVPSDLTTGWGTASLPVNSGSSLPESYLPSQSSPPPPLSPTPDWSGRSTGEASKPRSSLSRTLSFIVICILTSVGRNLVKSGYLSGDQSEYLSSVVIKESEGNGNSPISSVTLSRESVDHYVGTAFLQDGEPGDLDVVIRRHDWLGRPASSSWQVTLRDYAGMLAGNITLQLNAAARQKGEPAQVTFVSLERTTGSLYQGVVHYVDNSVGTIQVDVRALNPDGSPKTWVYAIP